MLSTLLFSVLLFNVAASPLNDAAAACTTEQSETAHQCVSAYYAHFNVTQFEFFNYVNAYVNMMNTQGVAGFTTACGWHNAIATCGSAAGANVSACFTDENFSAWFGVNHTEAADFRTGYFTRDYECNAGFSIVTQNFGCLAQVQQYDMTQINSCLNTYKKQLKNNKPFCPAYNQYITCIDQVYVAFCGPQVKPWICNMEEVGLEANYQGCDSVLQNCNAPSQIGLTTIGGILSEISK